MKALSNRGGNVGGGRLGSEVDWECSGGTSMDIAKNATADVSVLQFVNCSPCWIPIWSISPIMVSPVYVKS